MKLFPIAVLAGCALVFAGGAAMSPAPSTQPSRTPTPVLSPSTKPSQAIQSEELIVSMDSPIASTRARVNNTVAALTGRTPGGDALGMTVTPYPTRAVSSLVDITRGNLPIILSSPHDGTSQPAGVPARTGVGVDQFTTARDTNTRLVTEKLAAALEQELGAKPYVVIARFRRTYIDANRDAANAYEHPNAAVHYWAYHQALQRACDEVTQRYGSGIVIDVHGQGTDANAIFRGTRSGQSFGNLIDRFGNGVLIGPDSIVGQMQQRGYTFYPVPTGNGVGTETQYNGGFITYAYGAMKQAKVDSIQLETGGNLRSTTAQQNQTAADLAASIAHFYRTYFKPTPESSLDDDDGSEDPAVEN